MALHLRKFRHKRTWKRILLSSLGAVLIVAGAVMFLFLGLDKGDMLGSIISTFAAVAGVWISVFSGHRNNVDIDEQLQRLRENVKATGMLPRSNVI